MESLLQKFLTDAEESGLSEGQYLQVANALKKVFQEVEPLQSIPLTLTVEGKGGKQFSLVFKTISKKDRDISCQFVLTIGKTQHSLLSLPSYQVSEMLERLLLFCSADEVAIKTSTIKTVVSIDSDACFFKYLGEEDMSHTLPREYNHIASIVDTEIESVRF